MGDGTVVLEGDNEGHESEGDYTGALCESDGLGALRCAK